MAVIVRLLVFACCLLLASGALLAQDDKGYLGMEVRDHTKAEADKLGWDRR